MHICSSRPNLGVFNCSFRIFSHKTSVIWFNVTYDPIYNLQILPIKHLWKNSIIKRFGLLNFSKILGLVKVSVLENSKTTVWRSQFFIKQKTVVLEISLRNIYGEVIFTFSKVYWGIGLESILVKLRAPSTTRIENERDYRDYLRIILVNFDFNYC